MGKLFLTAAVAASLYAAAPGGKPEFNFDGPKQGWTVLHGAGASDAAVTHQGERSMRLESRGNDARVQSAPLALIIGKSYELTGWVRTDRLTVRDLDRSPIATGAALSMASLPFDVQSESLAGTRDWTPMHLRFTATRSLDSIVLTVAYGGTFDGKAWFSGVSVAEATGAEVWPASAAVITYGPAYRYPVNGWLYVHLEGQPYERGYQHGHLMAAEIPRYMERCAAELDPKGKNKSWDLARTTAVALFLRGFDQEILDEMKGIAAGASDAGARWEGRPIDLTDILVVNTTVELGSLSAALSITPNGLEGLRLAAPQYVPNYVNIKRGAALDHCSAFAATGPATRDGRMVIGHTTWWPLTLAEQTNVMLDIKPATGHRILMQSYPGGIESGTDWYQNDAGVVLTETTLNQSPFNMSGAPIAYRARKAIQYGDNIDQVVEILSTKNNGLYTNEWLLGDAKTDEIALFELGTYKSRLFRSSKNDWFGGTKGFYWGDNNTKDLAVRMEENPDPKGGTSYVPYVPTDRDLKWQALYREYKGKIDEQFGFTAFHSATLVSATAMDAKVVTAEMASRMMVWAEFGKPNQRERLPSRRDQEEYPGNKGLYPSGYHLITTQPISITLPTHDQPSRDREGAVPNPGAPVYLASNITGRLSSAILVYGTMTEGGANRYAAEELQKHFFHDLERAVPIRKDFEVSDEELRTHDVIFVGRPESNSALAAWQGKLGLESTGALFRIAGRDHASEMESLVLAAPNPMDRRRMVLVLAGNSALQTVLATKTGWGDTQYSILDSGIQVAAGFLK